MDARQENDLRFLESGRAEVNGSCLSGMLVCGASHVLGRLQGFVVDPVTRQLRYLVIRTAGLLAKTRLLPVTAARIDLDARAIQLLDEQVLDRAEPFTPSRFPRFDDDDLLKAMFGSSRAAA